MNELYKKFSTNQEFLNLLLNTTQNLIFVKDIKGRFLFANKAVGDLFGLKPEELIEKYNSELHQNQEEISSYNKIDYEVIVNKKTIEVTESFTKPNGEVRWFQTLKQPIQIENGETVAFAVSVDVTERRTAFKSLEESKKITEKILDNLPINIFAKDINGRFIFFNKKCAETTNIEKEKAVGKTDFDIFDEETAKKLVQKDKIAFEKSEPIFTEETIVSNGETKYLYAGKVPINISQDNKILLGFSMDITDRKLAEDNLRIINESLSELIEEQILDSRRKDAIMAHQSRLATLGEMIGNIAHQWKQPLSSLSVMIQEIAMACSTNLHEPSYIREIIDDCMQQIKYMSDTIDDFRDFLSPNKTNNTFNIKDVVLKAVRFLSGSFKANNISFEITDADTAIINGPENELLQAILNILSNSKDAIVENKIKDPYIRVSIKKDEIYTILTFEDNGGGIPDDIISKVFEPYFTTKETSKGTGIGLYMTKTIIEEHMSGALEIESRDFKTFVKIKLKNS